MTDYVGWYTPDLAAALRARLLQMANVAAEKRPMTDVARGYERACDELLEWLVSEPVPATGNPTPLQREVDPPPVCSRCGRPISQLSAMYRCAQCHALFDHACIREHFGWGVSTPPHEPMWLAQSAADLREIKAARLSSDLEWMAAALVDATEDPNTFQPTEHPDYWRWVAETITTRHDWPGLATGNPEEIDVERLEAAQNKHYENMAYRLHVCVGGCAADIAREYASESHPTKERTDG